MNNEENKVEEIKEVQPQPVKIEEPEEVKSALTPNNIDDKNSKKKTILLVLLFIFLFAFIMFMPNINDMLDNLKKEAGMSRIEKQAKQIEDYQNQQEQAKTGTKNKTKEELETIICTKAAVALENYDQTVVETFKYNTKKEVKESSIKTTYTFNENNTIYENLKTECTEDSLKYVDKKGYETACSYSETEVVIENTFDLTTFETIKDNSKVIEANVKKGENIDSIKTRLTSLGYTCG